MKKILGVFLGVLLLVPSFSFAQTDTASSTKAQLLSSLYALLQVLENEIAAIIAQQQTLQTEQQTVLTEQQSFTPPNIGTGPVGVIVTPPQPTATPPTPPEYPTPEVLNVVNDNATFSNASSTNGFTVGTFTLAYSGPWIVEFDVGPNGIGTPITQTQANDGDDCIASPCWLNGSDVEDLMVGLDTLPSPGEYTMTEKVYFPQTNQYASGSPMTFTFQVQ